MVSQSGLTWAGLNWPTPSAALCPLSEPVICCRAPQLRINGTRRLMEYDGRGAPRTQRHAADLARDRTLPRAGFERFGYSSDVVVHNAPALLRDADAALGRPHDPSRLRPWWALLTDSAFTPAGRARLQARWDAAGRHARRSPN